jgi:hypothetical protein
VLRVAVERSLQSNSTRQRAFDGRDVCKTLSLSLAIVKRAPLSCRIPSEVGVVGEARYKYQISAQGRATFYIQSAPTVRNTVHVCSCIQYPKVLHLCEEVCNSSRPTERLPPRSEARIGHFSAQVDGDGAREKETT